MKPAVALFLAAAALTPVCSFASLDLAISGTPQVAHDERDTARFDTLLRLSGMDQEIEEIPNVMVDSITSQARNNHMSLQSLTALQAEASQAFNPVTFRARVLTYMQTMLSAADADAVIAWLQTPLGKDLTAREVGASAPEVQQAMAEAASHPLELAPAREKLLRDLDRVGGDSESMVRVNDVMTLAMVKALAATVPARRQAIIDETQKRLAANHEQALATARKQALVSNAFIYKDVPQDKLEEYLRFNQTTAAMNFNTVTNEAFIQAVDGATRELFEALVRQSQPAPAAEPEDAPAH